VRTTDWVIIYDLKKIPLFDERNITSIDSQFIANITHIPTVYTRYLSSGFGLNSLPFSNKYLQNSPIFSLP